MHHILVAFSQSVTAQVASGNGSPLTPKGDSSFPDLLNLMTTGGDTGPETMVPTPPLAPNQKAKTKPQAQPQLQPSDAGAELLDKVKQLLTLASATVEASTAQGQPAPTSDAMTKLESALVAFVSEIQDVPLETRVAVADRLVAELEPQAEIPAIFQLLKSENPIEALASLFKQNASPMSTPQPPTENPNPERPAPVALENRQSPMASPSNAPQDTKPTATTTVVDTPDVPPQDGKTPLPLPDKPRVQASTNHQSIVPSEQVAEGGPLQVKPARNAPTQPNPTSAAPPTEKLQSVPQNLTVTPSIVAADTIDPADLRGNSLADMPARAQPSVDPSSSFAFARNVAAQLRGKSFEDGKTRIELSPRGLGDIEVEVARDDLGKHRVILRVENPAVLTALRQDREALLAVLRDSGLDFEESEVGFEEFGGHGFGQQREQEFATSLPRQFRVSHAAPEQPEVAAHQINTGQSQHGLDIVT